jgi:hypothetical protein
VSAILLQAWGALPVLWEHVNETVQAVAGARHSRRGAIARLGDTLAALYHQPEAPRGR